MALGLVAAATGAVISARDGVIGKSDAVDMTGATSRDPSTTRSSYRRGRSTLTGPTLVLSGAGLELIALILQMTSH